jgi:hypothetical protein
MGARDGASSIQGNLLRATKLTGPGAVDADWPVLVTNGFISASFSPEFEDGEEINQKAADGSVCVSYRGDDSLTRLTFNLSVCSPDPEVTAMLAGGTAIMNAAGTDVIGYSSPEAGAKISNPVAIEIWSTANVDGKPAADYPYWHWVFPYVKMRFDGTREFSNGLLSWEFSGQAIGNDALVTGGLPDGGAAGEDFVAYKAALANPFTYVRTTGIPTGEPMLSTAYPATAPQIDPA